MVIVNDEKRIVFRRKKISEVQPVKPNSPLELRCDGEGPSNIESVVYFYGHVVEKSHLRLVSRKAARVRSDNCDNISVVRCFRPYSKTKLFSISQEKITESKRDEVEVARRKDHVSHFVLRLAYCRTEELRRWFVIQETELFRARFQHANSQDIKTFMEHNNLAFTPISTEEMRSERENLLNGTYNISSGDQMEGRTFFKVPFTEALELIRTRKVFIKEGFAYVPDTELATLVTAAFRAKLSQALAVTNRALPQLEDDDRLMRLLQDFDKRYTGSDYAVKKTGSGLSISPSMIEELSQKSFPLCMRQMQDALRTNHHLRHAGRLQYGLFLKAAGLSLEDAMAFWRSHFTKIMDGDKFEKDYSYNIRYNYGKEGKRINYTPYSCIKIIMASVGPGDSHGCPFRHTDASVLKQRLTNFKVNQQGITEVMELVSKSHYQLACTKYWEVTHNADSPGINHPNQYFEESQKLLLGTQPATVRKLAPTIKVEKTVMYASQMSSTQLSSQSSTQNSTQDSTQNSTQNSTQITSSADMESMLFDDDMDGAMCESMEEK
ncbi:unnamed protein product, partial [Meganyctiphanes norvegica]